MNILELYGVNVLKVIEYDNTNKDTLVKMPRTANNWFIVDGEPISANLLGAEYILIEGHKQTESEKDLILFIIEFVNLEPMFQKNISMDMRKNEYN